VRTVTTKTAHPNTFVLVRHHDVSGVSGTGIVAQGVIWDDGTATIKWRGPHATVTHHAGGIDSVRAIHGHDGSTVIHHAGDTQKGKNWND
jgi:hypothetical protein